MGPFWCCYVTRLQLLFAAVLLATLWLLLAYPRLHKVGLLGTPEDQ
jgi:hypothetical protein